MKITLHKIELYKDKSKPNKFDTEQIDVALENEKYIILNDPEFTKLNKVKRGKHELYHTIEESTIYQRNWGISTLDGLVYTLYTFKNKRPETMRNEIQEYINEHFAWPFEVNLDFIRDYGKTS